MKQLDFTVIATGDHNVSKSLDRLRSLILSMAEEYPTLVVRWGNAMMGLWLLFPHHVFFYEPPSMGLTRYFLVDKPFGIFLICLALFDWIVSKIRYKPARWIASCISCVCWLHIMEYAWYSWLLRRDELLPLHFLGLICLFSNVFVPLRISSERRDRKRPKVIL